MKTTIVDALYYVIDRALNLKNKGIKTEITAARSLHNRYETESFGRLSKYLWCDICFVPKNKVEKGRIYTLLEHIDDCGITLDHYESGEIIYLVIDGFFSYKETDVRWRWKYERDYIARYMNDIYYKRNNIKFEKRDNAKMLIAECKLFVSQCNDLTEEGKDEMAKRISFPCRRL